MKTEKQTLRRQDLRLRTRQFALRIIKLVASLPKTGPGKIIGSQILRSGTSVGANYAEAFRSRSKPDYISKHGVCLQELEETAYWLDLLTDAEIVKPARLSPLKQETSELIAIFVSIIKSTKSGQ